MTRSSRRVTDQQQQQKEVDIDTIIFKIRLAMSFSAITRVAHPHDPFQMVQHNAIIFARCAASNRNAATTNNSLAIKRQTEINKQAGKS